ncbi:hypothetical protein CPB85DRAFT_1566329 [Mucidula mucida]|nr:hypothetical protein CPB85DRAFT_1566329 [Mucidula mucida]
MDASTKAALPGSLEMNGCLCVESIRSGWTVYVVIDNYNAPARACLIDSILVCPLRDLVADGLILGEYIEDDDGDYRNDNEDDDENWVAPYP